MSLKLSQSGIGTWKECPQKWRYHYQEGLGIREESSGSAVGLMLHVALEAIAKGQDSQEVVAAYVAESNWSGKAPDAVQTALALNAAASLWEIMHRFFPGFTIEACAEESISCPHPLRPDLTLRGRTDITIFTEGGQRILIDYKYRSRLKDPTPPSKITLGDAMTTYRNFQMLFYGLILRELGRPLGRALTLQYTVSAARVGGMKILDTPITDASLDWISAAILDYVQGMEAPPSPGDRFFPGDGSCYSYQKPCRFSRLCTAEMQGDTFLAAQARQDLLREKGGASDV